MKQEEIEQMRQEGGEITLKRGKRSKNGLTRNNARLKLNTLNTLNTDQKEKNAPKKRTTNRRNAIWGRKRTNRTGWKHFRAKKNRLFIKRPDG